MMKKILYALLLLLPAMAHGQTGDVYTVAGGGTSLADWVPATTAKLNTVYAGGGVYADATGNVYIADANTSTIRKVDIATGLIHTVAGGGTSLANGIPATNASLGRPSGVCLDALGNIYVSDYNNRNIRRVDATTGLITTVAGCGTCGVLGDGGPATNADIGSTTGSVVFDALGNMYLNDLESCLVRKVNLTTGIITTAAGNGCGSVSGDGGPATNATIGDWPSSLAIDQFDNIYIAGYVNGRIRKVEAVTGIITTVAGNGTHFSTGDGGPATNAGIQMWPYLAIDPIGNIVFSSDYSGIRKVDAVTGIISTIAGMYAQEIFIDQIGTFYFYAKGLNLLQKTAPSYIVHPADSFSMFVGSDCITTNFTLSTAHYHSGMTVKTYYGDATSSTNVLTGTGSAGTVTFSHVYNGSSTYTVKNVLFNGAVAIDSVSYPYHFNFCNTLLTKFYYDANSNCTLDLGIDRNFSQPVLTEMSVNGIPKDTLSTINGLYYKAFGSPGDVVGMRVISSPPGSVVSCPISGIIYDTLQSGILVQPTDYVAMNCTTAPGFDLQEYATSRSWADRAAADIIVNNSYCNLHNGTVTMKMSPKYAFQSSSPAPTSVSGGVITWDFTGVLSSSMPSQHIHATFESPGSAMYLPGDTVNSNYTIDPTIGDADPTTNAVIIIDTVKSGFDPNYIDVTPSCYILPGTTLKYGIGFENTGNDTAHNITVLDTLSGYLNMNTFRMMAASHAMNISFQPYGLSTIVKFDFPNINLLDSSHHDECHGMLMYSVNVRDDIAFGTVIPNRAGIYFDVNPVVMTNTVHNIYAWPAAINDVTNIHSINIFPNPANNELTIQTRQGDYASLIITSSIGNVVMQHGINADLTKLDIQALPPGIYYISLRGEYGVKTERFVKL